MYPNFPKNLEKLGQMWTQIHATKLEMAQFRDQVLAAHERACTQLRPRQIGVKRVLIDGKLRKVRVFESLHTRLGHDRQGLTVTVR